MNKEETGKSALLGWAAALATVLIGSGWQLATRSGVRASLAPVDLALLRYLIPALILAPVWWRTGLLPAQVGRRKLVLIVAGAGLPFGLLVMAGASLAPVAHMGALLPGTSPMLVALLAWFWLGTRPGRGQVMGFCLLGCGLMLITWRAWSGAQGLSWLGDLLFVAAGALWALYSLALRGSSLSPWQSAAVISAWSALGVVPLWCFALVTGRSLLPAASIDQLLTQAVWQGVVAGVVGLAVFGLAVKHVGAATASSVGALVPAVVALGGWILLGEALDLAGWIGVLAVVAGVWWATRGKT
jgi:drug/metabolite transporter (DMT)-like permease